MAPERSEPENNKPEHSKIKVLSDHKSMETAFLQEDYPYGRRLRCQRRVWVETAIKGSAKGEMRFVSQTSNPKKGGWNKPHPGQYKSFLLIYLNLENNHIEIAGVSAYSVEEVQAFKSQWYELLDEEQKLKLNKVEQEAIKNNSYWSRKSNVA
jgi:hypothetical protein